MSLMLGISRAAVWKRISKLKKEGYLIEASTKKGYRLQSHDIQYGKVGIQSLLNTEFIGRELRFFNTVESTNSTLKALASEGAVDGTVIISDAQSMGRGRMGRDWSSSAGLGIWMSILLRPKLHPAMIQSLTLLTAVAVSKALEAYPDIIPGIKWPNDILLGNKKCCGILTELSAEAERVSWVVTGIGININQLETDFPEGLQPTATSLRQHIKQGAPLNRCDIAAQVLNQFERIYCDYLLNGPSQMLKEWKERSVTIGRRVNLIKDQTTIAVKALDIGVDGRLVVEYDDGTIEEVISGEISLRNL